MKRRLFQTTGSAEVKVLCVWEDSCTRFLSEKRYDILTRLYTDFTIHCRGLYITSLYCSCFGDAGGAGQKLQAPEKMSASKRKNESEMENVCKTKKEKS